MMEKENFFCPICKGLSEEATDDVVSCSQLKRFNNESIYLQSDPYEGIYIVTKGEVRLSSNNEEGNSILIKAIYRNNTFGESGIPTSKYLENAYSIGESSCIFIRSNKLELLMAKHNEISLAILASMGRWLVDYHNRFVTLSLYSVRKRLELYLSDEAKKVNSEDVRLDLRKHEVASNLGVRPETLSRALKELEKEGQIKRCDGRINVTQLNRTLRANSRA